MINYISDYKENHHLRESFNLLAKQTFGIDFETWYQYGFYDHSYVCHSFVENGRVISNVSATKMQLIIDGKDINAIQIGTVMTCPECRMSGLAGRLMHTVIEEYEPHNYMIILFPNETVMDFYPRFSFRLTNDTLYSIKTKCSGEAFDKFRKLDIKESAGRRIIEQAVKTKIPLSERMDVRANHAICLWHCLNSFQDDIYIADSGLCVVIYKMSGDRIDLYDVITPFKILIGDILPALSGGEERCVGLG